MGPICILLVLHPASCKRQPAIPPSCLLFSTSPDPSQRTMSREHCSSSLVWESSFGEGSWVSVSHLCLWRGHTADTVACLPSFFCVTFQNWHTPSSPLTVLETSLYLCNVNYSSTISNLGKRTSQVSHLDAFQLCWLPALERPESIHTTWGTENRSKKQFNPSLS